jgi:hypothetical protein
MKALLLPLAACAVLAGCATYGDPYGYGYGQPGYGYAYPSVSGSVYYSNQPGYGYGYDNRYDNRQYRDRDRDGIPNRMDGDRDGDGIPNSMDRRPNNPRR